MSEVKHDAYDAPAPDVHSPADEDVADRTLLGERPVLVSEQWVQLPVQAVGPVGQSGVEIKRRRQKLVPHS